MTSAKKKRDELAGKLKKARKQQRLGRWTGWASEEEMASVVVEWLRSHDAEVYQEVQVKRGQQVADIVAVFPSGKVWVIETKMAFGLEVIRQALGWIGTAHMVSVAVPILRRDSSSTGRTICKALGIGLLEAHAGYTDLNIGDQINELVEPLFLRRANSRSITSRLTERHKTFARAGNARGLHLTPWKATCEAIVRLVKEKPGLSMKEVIEGVDHHYSSPKVARASMAKWIKLGKVEGLRSERDGKLLRLYVEENYEPKDSRLKGWERSRRNRR